MNRPNSKTSSMKMRCLKTSAMGRLTFSTSKIISFDNEIFSRLLRYVLVDHSNLSEKKVAYKFPNVSAEILSVPNSKVFDFFAVENDSGDLLNFDLLFSPFFSKDGSISNEEINFTRAGYIQKILLNLINNKPATFAKYLFKHKLLITVLQTHSYSKSLSIVLQNMIVLSTQSQNSNNQSSNSTGNGEAKQDGAGSAPDINKDTLNDRLDMFDDIIKACVQTTHNDSDVDLNSNLANVVMFILTKDFPERLTFLKKFTDNLDLIVQKFVSSYDESMNNKLGNIFLVFLEVFLKEEDKDLQVLNFPLYKLENYTKLYYELMQRSKVSSSKLVNRSQRTLSFSSEVLPVNLKLYKVMEALLIITRYYANCNSFDQSVFIQSGFEKVVFLLMLDHPFNNILHNQIKKFIVAIVESNMEALHDAYFVNNPVFGEFLKRALSDRFNYMSKQRKVKKGFVGPLLVVITSILKQDTLAAKINSNEDWKTFIREFYEVENQLENHVLGDVDVKGDNADQSETVFYFSVEEIKKKFAEFLDLSDEQENELESEENMNTSEERQHASSEENRSTENDQAEKNENPDLLQEIKDLDEHNPETSYNDFRYWKPEIDYNVEDLLNEMKN